jgi:hypothetical protein
MFRQKNLLDNEKIDKEIESLKNHKNITLIDRVSKVFVSVKSNEKDKSVLMQVDNPVKINGEYDLILETNSMIQFLKSNKIAYTTNNG